LLILNNYYRGNRTKSLFSCHFHFRSNVFEYSRFVKVAFVQARAITTILSNFLSLIAESLTASNQLRAFFNCSFYHFVNIFNSGLINQWTYIGFLRQRVTYFKSLCLFNEFFQKLISNVFNNYKSLRSDTTLTTINKPTFNCPT